MSPWSRYRSLTAQRGQALIVTASLVLGLSGAVVVPTGPIAAATNPTLFAVLNDDSLPSGHPTATGSALLHMDSAADEICYLLEEDGVGTITEAVLTDGPNVLATFTPPDGTGFSEGCVTVDPGVVAGIVADPFSHRALFKTADHPDGAVVGHLYDVDSVGFPCSVGAAVRYAPLEIVVSADLGVTVRLIGTGFPANTELDLELDYGIYLADAWTATSDANGAVPLYLVFEPGDEGLWTFIVSDPSDPDCIGHAFVAVEPTPLSIRMLVCPASIQNQAQLSAAGGINTCNKVMIQPDDVFPIPPGYTSNLVPVDFVNSAASVDDFEWTTDDAALDGGGTCNAATKLCSFGYGYTLDWIVGGPTQVWQSQPPSGYRIGWMFATSDGSAVELPTAIDADKVISFDSSGVAQSVWLDIYLFVGATPFTDIASSAFKNDIAWLYDSGITAGCSPTKYCPDATVTREQMAAFLDRALKLPATGTDFFTDDEASPFEANINRLAAAGITGGCATGKFCPKDPIKRDQMASFLARALELPPTATDYFTDDETNQHEGNINRLAKTGITGGCAATRYCPSSPVTRGQMAAFLHRALD